MYIIWFHSKIKPYKVRQPVMIIVCRVKFILL